MSSLSLPLHALKSPRGAFFVSHSGNYATVRFCALIRAFFQAQPHHEQHVLHDLRVCIVPEEVLRPLLAIRERKPDSFLERVRLADHTEQVLVVRLEVIADRLVLLRLLSSYSHSLASFPISHATVTTRLPWYSA